MAEVIPIYKKENPLARENYRPISLLSHVSKVFEKILSNQINEFMQPYFSDLLTGFRKHHSTQHSLIKMLEKWKYLLIQPPSQVYDCTTYPLGQNPISHIISSV